MIDNIIEELEPVLYPNEKDTHIKDKITEGCDDVKKAMGAVLSLLTGNDPWYLLYERARERNLKCTNGETNAHLKKYL